MAYSEAQLTTIISGIATLEANRASDLAAFLGSKPANGKPWDGSGMTAARAAVQDLQNN